MKSHPNATILLLPDFRGVTDSYQEPRIMLPRRFKKKSVRKIMEKRMARAIEEYEKTRTESNNAGGSGSASTRGITDVHGSIKGSGKTAREQPIKPQKTEDKKAAKVTKAQRDAKDALGYVMDCTVKDLCASCFGKSMSEVPEAVNKYFSSTLRDTLQKDDVSKFIKVKQERAAQEKMPKYLTTLYDQAAEDEHKQKEILFQMMMASKSHEKHPSHKDMYDVLIQSLLVDENDMYRLVVDHASHRKRRHDDKDQDPPAV
ncbi:hypothetical protein Tco_1437312 [Tanacetum coccineum]